MQDQTGLKLLAFENDWCAQCYTQRPIVQAIKEKFAKQLNVEIVNADEDSTTAAKYQVYSAPSLILEKDGQVVERLPRFTDQEQLTTLIRYYL